MLAVPDHLVGLHMPVECTQDDPLRNFPWYRECPAFQDPFALQDCLPRDSFKQFPEQANVCPLEVHGGGFAHPPPYFTTNQELYHITVAKPKTASNHHISHQSFSVCKQQVKRGTSPGRLTHQLCQEGIFHALQEPPRLFPLCCVVFPADNRTSLFSLSKDKHPVTLAVLDLFFTTSPDDLSSLGAAKQPHFPQPLLIRLVLQTLPHLHCPSLDLLQHLNVPLVVGGPKLNTVFETQSVQAGQALLEGQFFLEVLPSQGDQEVLVCHGKLLHPRHLQEQVCSKAVLVAKSHEVLSTGNGLVLKKGESPCAIAENVKLGERKITVQSPSLAVLPLVLEILAVLEDREVQLAQCLLGVHGDPSVLDGLYGQSKTCLHFKPVLCKVSTNEPDRHKARGFWEQFNVLNEKELNLHSREVQATLVGPVDLEGHLYPGKKAETLRAKQSQLPQPLPIRLVLQTLHQLRCPSLHTLQPLNVPLVVRGPKLNTVFEVRPHQCRVQGHDHFPSPAGHAISDTSQDAIGFLGHLGTLLAHIQAAVNQHAWVLFHQAAFQPLFPKPVALHGVAVAQVQDLALGLVKPHTIDLGPLIQPVQVPLQSLPTLQQINTPAQLGVICKLTEGALDPFVQIIDKDVKQNWPQHRALGNTTCDRPPTGVNSIHHHSLGPAIQPVLYPAKSTPVQATSSKFLQENAVGNPSLLVEPANGKAVAAALHLGRDLGAWATEARQEGPGLEQLEEVAMHITSLNMTIDSAYLEDSDQGYSQNTPKSSSSQEELYMTSTGMIEPQRYENPNFPEQTPRYTSWPPDKQEANPALQQALAYQLAQVNPEDQEDLLHPENSSPLFINKWELGTLLELGSSTQCTQLREVHKKLGGGTDKIVDPNWPKGCSITIWRHAQYMKWGELAGGQRSLIGDWLSIGQQVVVQGVQQCLGALEVPVDNMYLLSSGNLESGSVDHFLRMANSNQLALNAMEIAQEQYLNVEEWLSEKGHSLIDVSNPAFDGAWEPEIKSKLSKLLVENGNPAPILWELLFEYRSKRTESSFGSERATGVASVRSCWKLPLSLMEPMPASSKMDPSLAKAKTISDSGNASGITYLRRGKNCWATARREEGQYVRETSLQTPRSVKKEGEEVLQAPEQSFPCSQW
ncbi:hypothetical protein QYF61_015235 [Mycteria americana]|uniref:Uncharacterized protein n=1 Tax=Mycteria americana TaxID=33587 RepID=A0AAN7S3L7_MYCAM|nr:hypothetical protein QYF61_015235 [Mycteria americana]